MRFLTCLSLLSVFALTGCGGVSVGDEDSHSNGSYTYTMELNGCNTGEHSAGSLEDYCRNLRDDSLNRYCAKSMRREAFKDRCGSTGVLW